MTETGNLFIVAAPSGAGKTTLVDALIKRLKNIQVSISHTTRPKRPGEVDGGNYHFVTQDEFATMTAEGQFIEHATVFNHCYGTSKAWLEQQLFCGSDVILEIDWQGAQQIRALMPQIVSIFILPPSLETLERRLLERAQDDKAIIEVRMQEAQNEISHYHEFDYLVVNEDFETALQDLMTIFVACRLQTNRQSVKFRELLSKLL